MKKLNAERLGNAIPDHHLVPSLLTFVVTMRCGILYLVGLAWSAAATPIVAPTADSHGVSPRCLTTLDDDENGIPAGIYGVFTIGQLRAWTNREETGQKWTETLDAAEQYL